MALDWDDAFAYSTVKIVRIRDLRLGILHYLFMLAIIMYVVVYTIIINKNYLLRESPVGSMRMSLMQPNNASADWVPRNLTELNYCKQTAESYNGFPNYKCEYWPESLAFYPRTEQSAVFATTRVSLTDQRLDCQLDVPGCAYTIVNKQPAVFVADIESFTLMLDHSVYATKIDLQRNSINLTGTFTDYKGRPMQTDPNCPVCRVGQQGTDIMSLGDIMRAAGVDTLDQDSGTGQGESMRYAGAIFLLLITYSNTDTYNTGTVSYDITARHVKGGEFKALETIYWTFPSSLTEANRHGVRLLVLQVGELGRFDFQVMLVNLVSGMGLLAVATTLVDVLATKLLPQKRQYSQFKYTETEELRRGSKSVSYQSIDNPNGPLTSDQYTASAVA
eukprot:Colp12_sorted_trinity150504_noHs@18981